MKGWEQSSRYLFKGEKLTVDWNWWDHTSVKCALIDLHPSPFFSVRETISGRFQRTSRNEENVFNGAAIELIFLSYQQRQKKANLNANCEH